MTVRVKTMEQWAFWIQQQDWVRARRAMPDDLADTLAPLFDAAEELERRDALAMVPVYVRVGDGLRPC